jgi:hypothetical protein
MLGFGMDMELTEAKLPHKTLRMSYRTDLT